MWGPLLEKQGKGAVKGNTCKAYSILPWFVSQIVIVNFIWYLISLNVKKDKIL